MKVLNSMAISSPNSPNMVSSVSFSLIISNPSTSASKRSGKMVERISRISQRCRCIGRSIKMVDDLRKSRSKESHTRPWDIYFAHIESVSTQIFPFLEGAILDEMCTTTGG